MNEDSMVFKDYSESLFDKYSESLENKILLSWKRDMTEVLHTQFLIN
jgi:hypothetical protein